MVGIASLASAAGYQIDPQWLVTDTATGAVLQELPVTGFTCKEVLSGINEATINTAMGTNPQMVDFLQPWQYTLVLAFNGQPVWGGPIVKHRTAIGDPATEITVREWADWANRVWSNPNSKYEPATDNDMLDGGALIADRFTKAVKYPWPNGIARIKPPLADIWDEVEAGGDKPDLEFPSQFDGAYLSVTSPQSIFQEVQTVAGLGIDWRIGYVTTDTGVEPVLKTWRYNPDAAPVADLVVGQDLAALSIEIDTDQQATQVHVLGQSGDIQGTAETDDTMLPELHRVWSFDHIDDPNADPLTGGSPRLVAFAKTLLDQLSAPVLHVTSVDMPRLRTDIRAGDLVTVTIPPGIDPRFPDGEQRRLRVTEVNWSVQPGGLSTGLSLAANADLEQPGLFASALGPVPPLRTVGFVRMLRGMLERIEQLEARR